MVYVGVLVGGRGEACTQACRPVPLEPAFRRVLPLAALAYSLAYRHAPAPPSCAHTPTSTPPPAAAAPRLASKLRAASSRSSCPCRSTPAGSTATYRPRGRRRRSFWTRAARRGSGLERGGGGRGLGGRAQCAVRGGAPCLPVHAAGGGTSRARCDSAVCASDGRARVVGRRGRCTRGRASCAPLTTPWCGRAQWCLWGLVNSAREWGWW